MLLIVDTGHGKILTRTKWHAATKNLRTFEFLWSFRHSSWFTRAQIIKWNALESNSAGVSGCERAGGIFISENVRNVRVMWSLQLHNILWFLWLFIRDYVPCHRIEHNSCPEYSACGNKQCHILLLKRNEMKRSGSRKKQIKMTQTHCDCVLWGILLPSIHAFSSSPSETFHFCRVHGSYLLLACNCATKLNRSDPRWCLLYCIVAQIYKNALLH